MSWFNEKPDEVIEDYAFDSRTEDEVQSRPYDFNAPPPSAKKPPVQRAQGAEAPGEQTQEPEEPEVPLEVQLQEARQSGYDEGLRELEDRIAKMEAHWREQADAQMTQVLGQLTELEDNLVTQVQRVSTTLARAFAQHIVGETLKNSKDAVFHVTATVIEKASGLGPFRLCVHPDAVEVLEARFDELKAVHSERSLVAIEADSTLQFGDCRIVAEGGEVESFVHERIDRLAQMALMQLTVEPVPLRNGTHVEEETWVQGKNDPVHGAGRRPKTAEQEEESWGVLSSG